MIGAEKLSESALEEPVDQPTTLIITETFDKKKRLLLIKSGKHLRAKWVLVQTTDWGTETLI